MDARRRLAIRTLAQRLFATEQEAKICQRVDVKAPAISDKIGRSDVAS
jgi:hypothetical protein